MRAIVYERYGSPDRLELREIPRPEPRAGEVLVEVVAASVNLSDWEGLHGSPAYARLGGLFRPRRRILGSDIAGRIAAVGPGATRFAIGDEVFGDTMPRYGGFAEFVAPPDLAAWRDILQTARTAQSQGEIQLLPAAGPPVPVHLALNAGLVDTVWAGDPAFEDFLDTMVWQTGTTTAGATLSLQLSGLTPGHRYRCQLFLAESRTGSVSRHGPQAVRVDTEYVSGLDYGPTSSLIGAGAHAIRIAVPFTASAASVPVVLTQLVPGGGAAWPVQIRDDGGVARDREGRGRAGNAVGRIEIRAAIRGGLRVVPRCE